MLTLLFMGIVAVSFALTNKEKPEAKTEKKTPTTWRYTGTSTAEGQFRLASNWEIGNGSSCGPNGNKPCQLTADAADKTELTEHLAGLTNAEVMGIVDSKKN